MLAVLLATALVAPCQEAKQSDGAKYYLALFTWELTPYEAVKTHTFATVVRMKNGKPEQSTLSWFPATRVVRPVQLLPEKGVNMSLTDTLAYGEANKLRVRVWGPFEVSAEFYEGFRTHIGKFDRGEVSYRPCSAIAVQKDTVFDCAHAVENYYRKEQSIIGPPAFGDQVTGRIANELSSQFLGYKAAKPEVLEALGIAKHSSTKRELGKTVIQVESLKKP